MQVIEAEAAEYGPLPRNMFLNQRELQTLIARILEATSELCEIMQRAWSRRHLSSDAFTTEVRNRLTKLDCNPNNPFDPEPPITWIGNLQRTYVIDMISQQFKGDGMDTYFHGDLKLQIE
jgi:hypothetical protein